MSERRDMTRKALWLLACALAAGLIAVGCGGDDDGGGEGEQATTEATTEAPTKEEFVEQANKICNDATSEIRQEAAQMLREGGRPTPERIQDLITDVAIPNARDWLAQVRELQPPEGDEQQVDAILDAADEGVDDLEEDPSRIVTDGVPPSLLEAGRLSSSYGLTGCTIGAPPG